jgi:hypothetical protein
LATLNENCEIYQYVLNDTPGHPTRDVVVVRYMIAVGSLELSPRYSGNGVTRCVNCGADACSSSAR